MTEAWMRRDAERQELMVELKRLVHEAEDTCDDRLQFDLPFVTALVVELSDRQFRNMPCSPGEKAIALLQGKLLPKIRDFVRTPQEETAMVARLFLELATDVERQFAQPLRLQEQTDPRAIYAGLEAMDEVE